MPGPLTDTEHLEQPGFHGSWAAYVGRIWERREYLVHVPMSELRSQQMNSVLGNLWHLLNPSLSIAVYFLIFGVVLETDRGVDNFITFLAIGVFVYGFTQKSTISGSQSLVKNAGLIRSINFPRALIPIAAVITEALAFLPGVAVFLVVSLASGEPLRWGWLAVGPLIVLQTIFNIGAAALAARATNAFRDVRNLLPFLFRLLFYGSGVLFSADAYLEERPLRWLFLLNPVYDLVELYRWTMLGGPSVMSELLVLVVWTVVISVGGLAWFRRGEATYGA